MTSSAARAKEFLSHVTLRLILLVYAKLKDTLLCAKINNYIQET